MDYKPNYFGEIRSRAFQYWEQSTGRNCQAVNDDITSAYECKWQDRATSEMNYNHISIFCSLGEWANNISDVLQNDSYDYYDYLDEEHHKSLFRYYTRLMLIISEMLCDFEEIVQLLESLQTKKARDFLSIQSGDLDSVIGFINNVCKHKVGNYHLCNHHLPLWFEDCNKVFSFANPLCIKNIGFEHPDGILVPKLNYLIQVILNCYCRLDELFERETDKFKEICDKYNGASY
jgi:hypothetical protein